MQCGSSFDSSCKLSDVIYSRFSMTGRFSVISVKSIPGSMEVELPERFCEHGNVH